MTTDDVDLTRNTNTEDNPNNDNSGATDGNNNPIIPPQNTGTTENGTRDTTLDGDNTATQNATITDEQFNQLVNRPDFSFLIKYLKERYTPGTPEPGPADTTTPQYRRRSLFQDDNNTTQLSTQFIMDELATNRKKEADLERTIKEMRSKMHRATSSAPDIDKVLEETQQTPFTRRISEADMSQVGKVKIPTYDGTTKGTTDPISHLTAFTIAAGRARLSAEQKDPILCQLFVENLSGAALQWFSKLKPSTIDSFNDLSQAFMKQYSILVNPGESTADLYSIVQKQGESLRSYIDRFKSVASRVAMDDAASVEALRRGLWYECRFKETLSSAKPATLEDALHRASIYIKIEEERAALHKQHAPKASTLTKEKPKESHREPRHHYDGHRDDKKRRPDAAYAISEQKSSQPWNVYVREDDDNRSQNNDRSSYIDQAREKNDRSDNRHRSERNNRSDEGRQERNRGPYCDYHQTSGHSTSECRTLQGKLFNMYKRGELPDIKHQPWRSDRDGRPSQQEDQRQSNSRSNNRSNNGRDRDDRRKRDQDDYRDDNKPAKKDKLDVNVIMGGLSDCNDSVRSLKEHYRKAEASSKQQQIDRVNFVGDDLPIIFSSTDLEGLHLPHNDPLVITLDIGDCNVSKVLVDIGSSVDLLYKSTLAKMKIPETDIKKVTRTLTAFDNRHVTTIGTIKLPVCAGSTYKIVKFSIIDEPSVYNVIVGTPWIHAMKAVASSYHQCIRFPSGGAIFTIRGNQTEARMCFIAERKLRAPATTVNSISNEQPDSDFVKLRPTKSAREIVSMIPINPKHPEQHIGIGAQLDPIQRQHLETFLRKNLSTFAWTMEDMIGIDPKITTHELNVDPSHKPTRQKRRKLGEERAKAVNDEVDRLLKAGSICEVRYPEWLANPVVVKKKNGKWRVCVDFTDINKACPKDCFPLPHIDRLVESTAGNELLSFMDAFSGYNQILMHPDDREKTSFITDRGTYCYKVMPFGLKNAGATYQRLVNKMFAGQLGKTMEVYIDDMLVKSPKAEDHINHLKTCFEILNRYGMKLNPGKCTFGVTSGEFLGYIVTKRGIEANPKQISAIVNLPSPRNKREVQRLTGRIAALNRFVSRSTDRCLPFYQLLRSNKNFDWDDKCEAAFQELKAYLSTAPVLAKPEVGETLFLYVAVSDCAVSSVLVKEERGEQRPIFYISKTLELAETRYLAAEKIAFAVVTSARKLRPYFQSHPVIVLSDCNIRTILHSPSQSGRLTKWAVELSEYDIQYQPRKAHKSQVLADFIVELPQEVQIEQQPEKPWSLHVDGSVTKDGSGIGILLQSPTGELLQQAMRLEFLATNNETEYEALIAGLKLALGVGVKHINAHCDSQLVANQYTGEYETREERMSKYQELLQTLAKEFVTFNLIQIPRSENKAADALANSASKTNPYHRTIPIESIKKPSIDLPRGVFHITELDEDHDQEGIQEQKGTQGDTPPDWRKPIIAYLEMGKEPSDKWEARRLKARAAHYCLLEDKLYRRGSSGLLFSCVFGDETQRIMEETHEGAGGNHSGGRALAIKIRKHGHYWPTMISDCEAYSAKCEPCQRHARLINHPTELLASGVSPYPFMRWAMDIVGPLPQSHDKKKYVLVLTDYFTKWVEAKAYSRITGNDVVQFLWKDIICRHGLPYEIVTDNGTNLTSKKVVDFCALWKIRLNSSTPRYPQGNGQAEATNKSILDGLKKRLGEKKGIWSDELDGVLWSHRTTPRRATNQTPFSLSHGIEALAPAELHVNTLRRSKLPDNSGLNDEMLLDSLDNLEEFRDQALLRIQNYQQSAARYYNKKVRNRFFQEGDLVLRKVYENTKECDNKMGAKWEGPYLISKIVRPGVYELITMTGEQIPHSWNSINLKRYYY